MTRDAPTKPRLCHLRKWPDFAGYGFNLHAEKGRPGHFIGTVDEGSPALAGGLRQGDRIVEVNGTNIGNENHQQVVARIQSVPHETRILVVDLETDEFYRKNRTVVRGNMAEVETIETPFVNPFTKSPASKYKGKLCDLKSWPNFIGYGFNLHAEKGNPSHIIGKVDPRSPAEASGLKDGDRVVEVNGVNVLDELHIDVVRRIKSDSKKVTLLLVSQECEKYLREQGALSPSKVVEISHFVCPDSSPFISLANNNTQPVASTRKEMIGGVNENAGTNNCSSPETKASLVNSYNFTTLEPHYRLCHLKRTESDVKSFGFTMHASKGEPGHFITEVDPDSIAEYSGLKLGDRVIEVNGVNVEKVTHKQAVDMIKAIPNETFLLVINNTKDHDCSRKSNRDICNDESNKNKTNISTDYRLITDEMIEVAEREANTEHNAANSKTQEAVSSPERNENFVSSEISPTDVTNSKLEENKRSSVIISGIEFAPSAEEARRRMAKKSRIKEENLSIRDKFRLFEKL